MIRKITSETVTIGSFSTGLWFLGHCNENNVFVNDIGKGFTLQHVMTQQKN